MTDEQIDRLCWWLVCHLPWWLWRMFPRRLRWWVYDRVDGWWV